MDKMYRYYDLDTFMVVWKSVMHHVPLKYKEF
jgi:hypothetical protein